MGKRLGAPVYLSTLLPRRDGGYRYVRYRFWPERCTLYKDFHGRLYVVQGKKEHLIDANEYSALDAKGEALLAAWRTEAALFCPAEPPLRTVLKANLTAVNRAIARTPRRKG